MREVYKKLPKWNYQPGGFEYDLWLLDQKINQRGVAVDIDAPKNAGISFPIGKEPKPWSAAWRKVCFAPGWTP